LSPTLVESPAPRPLVVQSDGSILLETAAPGADEARDALLRFAELVKSPEHVHTWRLSPLSLWNAAAAGDDAAAVAAALERHARFPVPASVLELVRRETARWGRIRLAPAGDALRLELDASPETAALARELAQDPSLGLAPDGAGGFSVARARRGALKQALVRRGWPVRDDAGLEPGPPLAVSLAPSLALRPYQLEAVRAFEAGGGSGTIVLPCGAGKTVVGLAAIAASRARTLVVATGVAAARQWIQELLTKTTLTPLEVSELTGKTRGPLAPVTVATYSLLAHRSGGRFPHLERVAREEWGLVIFDEVHLLPAPVFRLAAELQARRRLGLTATLVREDGREGEVFSLVGPKRYSVPWKLLERSGWIAEALCTELKVPLPPDARLAYTRASRREQPALAAENPEKLSVLERLLARHEGEPTLVLGTYLDQLEEAAALANAPVILGATPARERTALLDAFRKGELPTLVLSRVGNHALDLPEASVAIQLSGTFGSRQEEAQRLGRILRPKKTGRKAHFYAVLSKDTVEEEYAAKRQLFLVEQGYRYEVRDAGELA
jgi:DNA excision repair protein ERCC-3